LVDDLDAEGGRGTRGEEVDLLAVDVDRSAVVRLHSGEPLDQGRLAGAVVADERGDLARVGPELHAFQHTDRPEAFDDVRQLDNRLNHLSVPFLRRLAAALSIRADRPQSCASNP
jgi:hypothetical protein